MKKPEAIRFVLSASKILSVNSLYNAKIMNPGRKQFAAIYKSGGAKKTEAYIKSQVQALGPLPSWINKNTKFDMVITVVFRSGLLRRDLDNTIKLIQDGIFRAIGVNDSHVMSIKAYKTLCPGIQDEKICIQLSEATGEPRFDKITEDLPSPAQVYLGGTAPTSTELISGLEGMGITWTTTDTSTPELELYVMDPGMNGGMRTICKALGSSYEAAVGHYGSVLLGVMGTEEEWGADTWGDIKEIIEDIRLISGGSPRIVAKFISNPGELLECIKKPKKKKK